MLSPTNTLSPSLYERFNARQLEPREVAQTFIPPTQYWELAKPVHHILIGPRGSGKTTLLKMLTSEALDAWTHPQARTAWNQVTYSTALVPTDITWTRQLRSLTDRRFSEEDADLIVSALFTAHMLRALARSLHSRTTRPDDREPTRHLQLVLTAQEEAATAAQIADSWNLELAVPSFYGVASALSTRISRIANMVRAEGRRGPSRRSERISQIPGLFHDFLPATIAALDIVVAASSTAAVGQKYAFLIDELELAPATLQRQLATWMRSVDERLLFKLAISPFNKAVENFRDALAPKAGHDFTPIVLSYPRKEKAYKFCEDMLAGMLQQRGLPGHTSHELFGPSAFDPDESGGGSGTKSQYVKGRPSYERIERMARTDPSFAEYLVSRDIDLETLARETEERRASSVRKLPGILAIREEFQSSGRGRSRKNPTIYSGATTLFAMVEGNPRLFIGVVGALISQHAERIRTSRKRPIVPVNRQSEEISSASARFLALLETLSAPGDSIAEVSTVSALLSEIGQFVHEKVVRGRFNSDPPLTFFVDRHYAGVDEALGQALNAGAIVYVGKPGKEDVLTSTIGRDKRFRLSYLLAPQFKTPILLGRPASLSEILRARMANRLGRRQNELPRQMPFQLGPGEDSG